MKTLRLMVALASLLGSGLVRASEVPKSLTDAQFDYALRNNTTQACYVLVMVVDGNSGQRQSVCLEAQALLTAIHTDRRVGYNEATTLAAQQADRTFTFSNSNALRNVTRMYSDPVLQKARDFLAPMTDDELDKATRDPKSEFYKFCAREPRAFLAVAHVLSERGILCTRSPASDSFQVHRGDPPPTPAKAQPSRGGTVVAIDTNRASLTIRPRAIPMTSNPVDTARIPTFTVAYDDATQLVKPGSAGVTIVDLQTNDYVVVWFSTNDNQKTASRILWGMPGRERRR